MKKSLKSISYLLVAMGLLSQTAQAKLEVKTITANEPGFLVNSHLIMGEKEAFLVDAQFTRSQAKRVVEAVEASGRELKAIYVTHAHPDHYFGLETLSKAFPKAKLIAQSKVVKEIQATAFGKLEYWKKMYGEELPDQLVLPEANDSKVFELEGNELKVGDLNPGESESASVLYIPSLKALIAGDLIYNQVHLWLAEDRPEGWLKNLHSVTTVGPIEQVYSGHGANAKKGILKANEKYIKDFLKVTSKAKTKEVAIKEMKAKYPNYALPIILELSVGARVK